MKKLALYGAGDLGSEILELCKRCQALNAVYDDVFFVDDNPSAKAPEGFRLIDFDGLVYEKECSDVKVTICIGEPQSRREVRDKVCASGIELASLVHPAVEIPSNVRLGDGCVVSRGSYIGPNTTVGDNTLILRGYVAHHCDIGSNCVLDAHATLSCHVRVGEQTYLSIGSSVTESVTIGSRAIIGVGAAVFLDVEDDIYMVGNPARPMRRNEDQRVFRA